MDVATPVDAPRIAALIRRGWLDAELSALISLLAGEGMSLVVAQRGDAGDHADEWLAALAPARPPVDLDGLGDGATALLRAASLGSGFAAIIRADSLEGVFDRLRWSAGVADDELSYLGLVVVLDATGRVSAAHYVRPIALDGQGHVQRLPPAVLAARDPSSGRLEHFAWGVLPELASRIRWRTGDLEAEAARRSEQLGHAAGHPP